MGLFVIQLQISIGVFFFLSFFFFSLFFLFVFPKKIIQGESLEKKKKNKQTNECEVSRGRGGDKTYNTPAP